MTSDLLHLQGTEEKQTLLWTKLSAYVVLLTTTLQQFERPPWEKQSPNKKMKAHSAGNRAKQRAKQHMKKTTQNTDQDQDQDQQSFDMEGNEGEMKQSFH